VTLGAVRFDERENVVLESDFFLSERGDSPSEKKETTMDEHR
jgi:hypothetical protein